MKQLAQDHIYVILLAFLAAIGCFTAVALVGTDSTTVSTLRDVLLALSGSLGTAYVATRKTNGADPPPPPPPA